MPYTVKDYFREVTLENLDSLTLEERIKGIPTEEFLKKIAPEEALKFFFPDESGGNIDAEQIKLYIQRIQQKEFKK
jgi:hypothetical protein